jgi:hypothetical protein
MGGQEGGGAKGGGAKQDGAADGEGSRAFLTTGKTSKPGRGKTTVCAQERLQRLNDRDPAKAGEGAHARTTAAGAVRTTILRLDEGRSERSRQQQGRWQGG